MSKLKRSTQRLYLKYNDRSFTTPTLAQDWDVAGTGFGVETSGVFSTNYAYKAFDKLTSTTASLTNVPNWLVMYNVNPLKLSSITIDNWSSYFGRTGSINASNDGNNWTQLTTWSTSAGANVQWSIDIPLSARDFYHYYRINFLTANSTLVYLKEVTLNGVERLTVPGTSSDYSYFRDVYSYHTVLSGNKHYAL